MKRYLVNENCKKEVYRSFIEFMLLNSDTFSLVYFRYSKAEKMTKSVQIIYDTLKPYMIRSSNGNQWPGTTVFGKNEHIYEISLYSSTLKVKDTLAIVDKIFDWNYPNFPMDLCFYKDGYEWYSSTSHEKIAYFFVMIMKQF